ncbi:MAG: response regulator [Rhodanobacteraceae bacterium]|nr:response regulator [Rhodanobacteraceae bacterium]MBP9153606.1 response regulator [Xanthomonadales bacterium]
MTSMERNANGRPGLGMVITLLALAVVAVLLASGFDDRIKPLMRYVAAGTAALFTIIAIIAAMSVQRRWARLLEAAEAKPILATPKAQRLTPSAATPANLRELETEIERLRNVERELTSAKVDAESAMMAKGEFLATMSHEIRTPLNGIIPLLDLVLSTKLAPDQKEYLSTAFQSSKQLLSIVDDILDFSKLEANKLELETTGINVKEIVDGVSRLMARNAESKGLQYSSTIDPNVRLAMRGDPTRLRQVLTNLVSNAIKFTERGAVAIQVNKRSETRTHTELLFAIRDTGVGVSAEGQKKLFQEFSQADNSTTRTFGGTGLGLSICKRIVDLMGGQIGVKSEVGKGSVFWFTVPLLKALGDVQPARSEIEGSRALIVTGDQAFLKRIGTTLTSWKMPFTQNNAAAEVAPKLKAAAGGSMAVDFLILDFGSMRATALSILRSVSREVSLEQLHVLAIGGEDQLPEDVRTAPRCTALERGFSDGDLRAAMKAMLTGTPTATSQNVHVDMLVAPTGGGAPVVAAAAVAAPTFVAAEARVGGLGGHVLLVEDNPVNRQVAQRLLTLIGLSHEHAENGRLAVEKLESGAKFDAVLMDCQMPIMDGYTATRYIRKLQGENALPKFPIVAMTANAMVGDREKCIASGMDDYMSKPLNRGLLEQMLQKWLPPGATSRTMAPAPAPIVRPVMPVAPAPTHADATPINTQIVNDLMDMMGAEFADLVRVYLEDSPKALAILERAAANNDLDGLVAPAHSLKSTSANLGALMLADMAKRIEHGARSGNTGEPVLLVAQLTHEFQRVSMHLRHLLAQMGQ